MSAHDGGPAFPTTPHYQRDGDTQHFYAGHYGMSLRDYFAGQVIGMAAHDLTDTRTIAQRAYAIADAMLAERER